MLSEIHLLQKGFVYVILVIIFTIGWFLKVLPFFKSMISVAMCRATDSSIAIEVYWDSLFTWEMLQNVYRCMLTDMNKKVEQQSRAYNCPLVSVDGKTYCRLLDFAKGSRPLVVNFGSSTCPIFMEKLKLYRRLIDQFSEVADFLLIYIEEAHPADGWAFKENDTILTHKSQDERCRAALKTESSDFVGCPLMVDTMLNASSIAYGAVPIRLYVIQDGKIAYQGGAGPVRYRIEELSSWLDGYKQFNLS